MIEYLHTFELPTCINQIVHVRCNANSKIPCLYLLLFHCVGNIYGTGRWNFCLKVEAVAHLMKPCITSPFPISLIKRLLRP